MGESIQSLIAKGISSLINLSETPELDCEMLLCRALKKDRSFLRTWPERSLNSEQSQLFYKLLELRAQGTPIAYLMGTREFWSREFYVDPSVLIPRPDTECLIEISLDIIQQNNCKSLLDLGTGSGAIAITLAAESPSSRVTAVDISQAATSLAEKNATKLGIHNVNFLVSDWFSKIQPQFFDLIVSNPPYISPDDPHLTSGDLRFEPIGALMSQDNGLADIETIIEKAPAFLASGARLIIEHGYNQHLNVQQIFRKHGYTSVKTYYDLSNHPRVTLGTWQHK
jgi:release factor glutamine methyltransferase